MSVVGFDIGNYKSTIGIARAGGIEIIANEYSDRITPTYVSYTNKLRFQGHAAKQQEITNNKNTLSGFKRFLARRINDAQVKNELTYQQLRVGTNGQDDKVVFNVDYLNETRTFTPEQLMATFLSKLKTISEKNLNAKVADCVISVPCYMSDVERRALLDASQIAGLNSLKLMNETTAIALTYGLYNNSLPEVNEKPHTVAFVDLGYTHLQACVVAFNKGKLRVISTTYDNNLGGRDFDRVLCDYFNEDFKKRYNLDAYSNHRATLRLRAECEKLKKLMSSNSSAIPLNIECFMNDKDVSGKMKREEFEALSQPLLNRIKHTLGELLKESNMKQEDIDLIEIVGGSTRIPAVKQIVHEVFGKEPATTLNADEACARGCTIMCAIMSPTFKVKEFKIEECQLFPITLSWKGAETEDNELEVFQYFEKIPSSKLLTIYKREPFEIEARYRFPNNIPFGDARIGKFYIGNVTPNQLGENSEIKLKARITKNGIFEISSPQLVETYEVQATEPEANAAAETKSPEPQQQANGDVPMEEAPANGGQTEDEQIPPQRPQQPQQPQKKKKTKVTDLPLTAKVAHLTTNEINYFMENELAMIQEDRKENERSEAKNSVEEYIYDIRDKLSNEFEHFVTEDTRSKLFRLLDDTESWLYSDEAEDQEKSVYLERLQVLKNIGEPIKRRYRESQERPFALESLGKSLQLVKKAIDLYYKNDPKYDHLDKADVERVVKVVEEKQKWFDEKSNLLSKMKPTDDPIVLASQIKDEKDNLDRVAWGVLNKPKPKVEPPKQSPEPPKQQTQQQDANKKETGNEQNGAEEKMDT